MLNEEIKKGINQSDIICFDIFDTLVSRACPPDYTKEAWAIYLSAALNRPEESQLFLKWRQDIEKELCDENISKYNEPEFIYADFADRFFDVVQPTEYRKKEFITLCERIEVSIEKRVQHVNPGIIELLKYCQAKHKTLVCASDMYLSKNMLHEILSFHKINKFFDEIIVSNEIMKTKRTGMLYKHIKTKFPGKSCFMFGNNFEVDVDNARKNGFSAYHLDSSVAEAQYELLTKTAFNREYSLSKFKTFFNTNNTPAGCNELKLLDFFYKVNLQLFVQKAEAPIISKKATFLQDRYSLIKNEMWLMIAESKSQSNFSISVSKGSHNNTKCTFANKNRTIYSVTIDEDALDIDIFIELLHLSVNKHFCFLTAPFLSVKPDKPANIKLSTSKKKELRRLGKTYAPVFSDFARWIKANCEEEGIKKVFFFTREGEFFKEVFDIIKGDDIQSEILEVSRVATFCASIKKVSTSELMRVWNQYSKQSVLALCKTLSIPVNEFLHFFNKYHISISEEIVYPWQDPRVDALFNDEQFVKALSKCIESKKKLITKYFKSKGLENTQQNIAIVDIGWRGTIQDNVCLILNKTHIFGYYFGLEDFLNQQPTNASKKGYINRYKGYRKIINNVTPLEMICNSPNGSTTGYSDTPDIHALRKIDEIENQSYYTCSKLIQEGVVSEVKKSSSTDLTSPQDVFRILTKMVFEPNKNIARAYFKLKHNEEFGAGEYMFKQRPLHLKWGIMGIASKSHRELFIRNIFDSTWPQGFLADKNLTIFNKYRKVKNIKIKDDASLVSSGRSVAWVVPAILPGSGGHRTIVQNANALAAAGYACDIYVENDFVTTSSQMKNRIAALFGECLCDVYVGYDFKKQYDLAIATYSETTPPIVDHCPADNKAYFIQDFEPWFAPMGDQYLKMEKSYRYNFKGVCIGNWLSYKIKQEYGKEVKYFPFCADLDTYHPINIKKEQAICFIFQPEKPRRCWELGIKALEIVKEISPETTIYLYGSPSNNIPIPFEHVNLQIISPEKCNELYNKCRVGLCISASNPSRIPFEMMAAGLPVVDLYRENNLYDMPDEGILLAESTPEAIATALMKIINNDQLAKAMSSYGNNYMKDYPLERGFKDFISIINSMFEGNQYESNNSKERLYKQPPVTASEEVNRIAFEKTSQQVRSISRREIFRRRFRHLTESVLRRAKRTIFRR